MNKRINVYEDFKAGDNAPHGLYGEVIFGKGRHQVEYINPYGVKATRTEFNEIEYKSHNIIPIGGYQWWFSKAFNIGLDQDTTLRVGDLNDEAPQMKIGVPREKYQSIYYDTESSSLPGIASNRGVHIPATNFIFGFMIGDGGAREDNMTAIAHDYKARSLFRPIPFRMSNDGYELQNNKYYGKTKAYNGTDSTPFTSYYIKTFDDPSPRIIHAWVTNNPNELEIVDDTVFSSTSSLAIESYVEINFSLDAYDTRGYFSATNSTPRVNEFSLVSGWYNPTEDDYESIRAISLYSRPTISLAENDYFTGIYRIYAR